MKKRFTDEQIISMRLYPRTAWRDQNGHKRQRHPKVALSQRARHTGIHTR